MTQIVAPTHPFDAAVELVAEEHSPDAFRGHTAPAYANMVGPFGGITAATLLRAVLQHPARLGDPLSLTVNFAGPIADGEFEVSARPTRTNRSTQHWSIELVQDGVVTTTATAVFGIRRETWDSTEITAPSAPPADDVAVQSFPDFIAWARNYELRFVEGPVPEPEAGAQPDSTSTLWARDNPPRPLDFPALTALCDVFYPARSCVWAAICRRARCHSRSTSMPTRHSSPPRPTTPSSPPLGRSGSARATSTSPVRSGVATAPCSPRRTSSCTSRTEPL